MKKDALQNRHGYKSLARIPHRFKVINFFNVLSLETSAGAPVHLVSFKPPFIFYFFNVTYKTLSIFFRHCATFFENFLMSQKSPPFEFFDILQLNVCS